MRLLPLLLGVLALGGCGRDREPKLPPSKGLPSELLVVCDPRVAGSDLRDSVMAITEADAPGLGSAEPVFRVNNIGMAAYKPTFYAMHSKVFFLIEKGIPKAFVGISRDVKARPQIEVYAKAPDLASMRSLLSSDKDLIRQALLEFQVSRLSTLTRNKYSKKVSDELEALAGYTVRMPTDMVASKLGEDFLWAGSNRAERDINFLFYTYPWVGGDISDVGSYVERRDSVLRANIPGSLPGQWMETSRGDDGTPVLWARMRQIGGRRLLEARGLWELHGGYMGGPFVALVSVDTVERKVVVGEGFVYSPEGQKRDLMRQLEGCLRTLRKVPPQTPAS